MTGPIPGALEARLGRVGYTPEASRVHWETQCLALECPVAIEINGIAFAVMMATPLDLEDFVTGFLMAEGLARAEDVGEVALHAVDQGDWGQGMVARVSLPSECLGPVMERARRRIGDSSCGICGLDGIETALRPLPVLATRLRVRREAVGRALGAMRGAQTLGQATRATHAAAFCDAQGALLLVREDVGRHNALDKLVGALARTGTDPATGFIVMTSRCSYELVEKTVRAGCSLLVTISAPTDLAARRAKAAGLALCVVAREDSMFMTQVDGGGPFIEP
ncbi:formate dehydrogenase accessory sulfurtransferase FdhD [Novosphingobium profundi]|uniref:formate dehydrogenase accessory sulfurtransferase FdhD n=1 Tax=Novosphingobium profundi TaxID=1774954 RepID=UPI001BD965CD|nr:formate dehydrogenase accessory sulfurtransferase FdhD [Novosphingobium profundi]MBT0667128.1 formate dehydrogenase accessory sulfurtransferase FdhD [Novosphingobium profundi]